MSKKLSYEEVKTFIENEGYILLSKEYVKSINKLDMICPKGHNVSISYNNFKKGKRCGKCFGGIKFTYEEVKNYVEIESNSGCKFISKEYNNYKQELLFECSCGKPFTTTFNRFKHKNKRHCDDCGKSLRIEKRKFSYKEVKEIIENLGYELLSNEYLNNLQKLLFKDKDGYLYYSQLSNLKMGRLPEKFNICNPYTIQNIKLWCQLNNKQFELVDNEYVGSHEKLYWQCLKEECGEIFECDWSHIQNGDECGVCRGLQVGMSNCLATLNPELAKEWHPTKNILSPYEVTCSSHKYIWWKCEEGHEWKAFVANRNKGRGCPECNETKGEKRIREVLTFFGYSRDKQYSFNDLIGIGGGLLRFDESVFWDKEKTKLRMLIEYDGIFHYEKQYKGDNYETIQIHDQLKNKYCKENNIPLIRIPYWEFDNIEEILKDIFIYNNINNKFLIK